MRLRSSDPVARTLLAITGYQFEVVESRRDTADEYLLELSSILEDAPGTAEAHYARASILTSLERSAAAREAWADFLELEREGPWAEVARERLGRARAREDEADDSRCQAPALGVALGTPDPEARQQLGSFVRRRLSGPVQGSVYARDTTRALALGGSIELVEQAWSSAIREPVDCGPPRLVVATTLGELEIYTGFAIETRSGAPHALIIFALPPPVP